MKHPYTFNEQSWSVRKFPGMKDLPMASSSTLRCGHPKSARSAIICAAAAGLSNSLFSIKSLKKRIEIWPDAEGLIGKHSCILLHARVLCKTSTNQKMKNIPRAWNGVIEKKRGVNHWFDSKAWKMVFRSHSESTQGQLYTNAKPTQSTCTFTKAITIK